MSSKLVELVEKIQAFGRRSNPLTVINGTTNTSTLMAELIRESAMLLHVKDGQSLDTQLDKVVATLRVAEATSVIGTRDFDEVIDLIDSIKQERI